MSDANTLSHHRFNRWTVIAGFALIAALTFWFARWTGNDQTGADYAFRRTMTGGFWMVLFWLCASIGFGWPLRLWLAPNAQQKFAIQVGLGIAAMLWLDAALGTLGWLQLGAPWTVVVICAAGTLLWLVQTIDQAKDRYGITMWPLLLGASVPAVAVLLVACGSAAGWLWETEFGGYDALSYHLQLPKEWLAVGGGRIQPLHHNIYSFLPGYMEAAYYHIAVLTGDGIRSVYACQLLHVSFTLISAWMAYQFVLSILGGAITWRFGARNLPDRKLIPSSIPAYAAIAAVVMLGTPWVIVVGSLAYNEMAVVLMLLTGLLVINEGELSPGRRGAANGLLAGAACGVKLTALGMAALPLVILQFLNSPPRHWYRSILACGFAAIITLSPYFIRNLIDTGNPVFPFASSIFGLGHWSADQHAAFARGHISDAGIPHRLAELWNQILRYGIGSNPHANEPWKPQWSILPWLAMIGLALGTTSPKLRRWSFYLTIVLVIQVLFWLFFTHLKSRFMLPAVVPMAIGVAIGAAVIGEWVVRASRPHGENAHGRDTRSIILTIGVAVGLLAWACQPIFIFRSERNGAPAVAVGQVGAFTGDDLTEQERIDAGSNDLPSIAINYLLPKDAKVLFIGHATPLYFRGNIVYQTTWDRGPLSMLMREFPDDPEKWSRSLRADSFTHLLVDETMLTIWEKDGWNDPLITRARVMDFAERFAAPEYRYGSGVTILRLRD